MCTLLLASGIIKFKCEECGKFCITELGIRKHAAYIHQNAEHKNSFKTGNNCEKCNKSFASKSNLNAHIKSVHENVRYNCNKCDKSYSWICVFVSYVLASFLPKQRNFHKRYISFLIARQDLSTPT